MFSFNPRHVLVKGYLSCKKSKKRKGAWAIELMAWLVYVTEKRADHSLRDEQICCSPLSSLCAVAPRFSVDVH